MSRSPIASEKAIELENSLAISIYAEGTAAPVSYVIFPSADNPWPAAAGEWTIDAATGGLIYQKWVCYYYDEPNQQLARSELVQAPLPGTTPPPLGDPAYPDLATMQAQPQQVVARRIAEVDFQVDTALPGGPTVVVRVAAEGQTASDRVTRVAFHSRVFPRNTDTL
ncbi:MAG: hypothetical protein HY319_31045 [Armatimonadetes bacterium]|nr:hypothetical protein [Armatimonadota bacterium]